MPLPDGFLDELVSRTDITTLVGEYVRLNKKSGNNMFGLCPFHSEKTASFTVNSEKQIFHCFGCGKGGGAISFIREIENVPFRDAIEILARKVNMTVPEEEGQIEFANRRKRILQLNREAARHFHSLLSSPPGEQAREYLATRGISKTSVTKFGIGVAPDQWSSLFDAMMNKGFSQQELFDAGLARAGKNNGSPYDFFRNRLMFPVIDVRGSVIGFSGRRLDAEKDYKYVNSPDTPVFTKSRNLFALNLAKKSKAGILVLVEGNIDVVMLHQAGFDCAVAPLGTALTSEQSRLLAQYTEKIVIVFDSDEMGQKATLRALTLIEKTGKNIKVVDLGASGDPDDFIRKHGADAFKILLERSDSNTEYKLLAILNTCNINTDEGRLSYLGAATELLADIKSEPEREIYGAKVAQTANVSVESVKNEITKKIKNKIRWQKRDFEKDVVRTRTKLQPSNRELRYTNDLSAVAEEGIIRLLALDTTLLKVAIESEFSKEEFTSDFLAKIYETIKWRISDGRDVNEAVIMAELESAEASQLTAILQKPESLANGERIIREYIGKIRAERLKTQVPDDKMLLEIKRLKEHRVSEEKFEDEK
ncbi:MAG: DNA primase [Oscillospiraceae bacterium]|jgi:DNA primase|nr:DNA primase [Oscillospiraceae bacterium]